MCNDLFTNAQTFSFLIVGSVVTRSILVSLKNRLKISWTSKITIKILITKLGKTNNGLSFHTEMNDSITENNCLRSKKLTAHILNF